MDAEEKLDRENIGILSDELGIAFLPEAVDNAVKKIKSFRQQAKAEDGPMPCIEGMADLYR